MKGPDPSEFDPEFVIRDENATSRSGTPRPPTEETQDDSSHDSTSEKPKMDKENRGQEQNTEEKDGAANTELPTDVLVKLRKLEKFESRYNGMRGSSKDILKCLPEVRAISILPYCSRTCVCN